MVNALCGAINDCCQHIGTGAGDAWNNTQTIGRQCVQVVHDVSMRTVATIHDCSRNIETCAREVWTHAQALGRQFVYVAHMVSMKALDAICKFFKEADSVNNIMRLVSSGVDFLKKIKWNTFHFESFANTFKPVIPFFSAKGVFQKIQSLASGEAASQDVFPGECNWWKVASKITSGLSDIITGAKWLTEMKLLPDGWSKENLPKPIHGVSLNAKDSVQDALGVISSTTNIISTARKIWRTWTVSFKSLFDIAMDVARIAATLFKNAAYFAPKESPVAAIGLFVGVCVGTGSLAKSIVEAF